MSAVALSALPAVWPDLAFLLAGLYSSHVMVGSAHSHALLPQPLGSPSLVLPLCRSRSTPTWRILHVISVVLSQVPSSVVIR